MRAGAQSPGERRGRRAARRAHPFRASPKLRLATWASQTGVCLRDSANHYLKMSPGAEFDTSGASSDDPETVVSGGFWDLDDPRRATARRLMFPAHADGRTSAHPRCAGDLGGGGNNGRDDSGLFGCAEHGAAIPSRPLSHPRR